MMNALGRMKAIFDQAKVGTDPLTDLDKAMKDIGGVKTGILQSPKSKWFRDGCPPANSDPKLREQLEEELKRAAGGKQ